MFSRGDLGYGGAVETTRHKNGDAGRGEGETRRIFPVSPRPRVSASASSASVLSTIGLFRISAMT